MQAPSWMWSLACSTYARPTADTLLADITEMFPQGFFPTMHLRTAQEKLQKFDWVCLSHWHRWCQQWHPAEDLGGPDTEALHDRNSTCPAAGRQKNIIGAKHCPATQLRPDISKERHVVAALQLPHPFLWPARL